MADKYIIPMILCRLKALLNRFEANKKCSLIKLHTGCRQLIYVERKGSGNKVVSRVESAGRIYFCRGKQQVSRRFCRWNQYVCSSVSTRRNFDLDEGRR